VRAYARAWVRVKMGKCCFESGIVALHFGENYASLPLPISEEAWRTRTCFIIKSVARFTIIRQMAPRPRVQSGLSAALENLAIVIVYFLSLYVFVCVCCFQCGFTTACKMKVSTTSSSTCELTAAYRFIDL